MSEQDQIPASEDRKTEAYFHVVKGGAAFDVLAERFRQHFEHGWTPEHDDQHDDGQLALAAVCYAMPEYQANAIETVSARGTKNLIWRLWPFERSWWKPKGVRSDLVRAAALIIAEIERLDRAAAKAEAGR